MCVFSLSPSFGRNMLAKKRKKTASGVWAVTERWTLNLMFDIFLWRFLFVENVRFLIFLLKLALPPPPPRTPFQNALRLEEHCEFMRCSLKTPREWIVIISSVWHFFFFLLSRLLERIDEFEKKLLDSSALQNTTKPLTFSGENFAVVAQLTCIDNETGFPGRSIISMPAFNNLVVNITDNVLNLHDFIQNDGVHSAMTLPTNFATHADTNKQTNGNSTSSSDNSTVVNGAAARCQQPIAVAFHVFSNSKLFQSSTGSADNLNLPSTGLLLGQDLSVINSAVISASLSPGLNTDSLVKDAVLLFQEIVPIVRLFVKKTCSSKDAVNLCLTKCPSW